MHIIPTSLSLLPSLLTGDVGIEEMKEAIHDRYKDLHNIKVKNQTLQLIDLWFQPGINIPTDDPAPSSPSQTTQNTNQSLFSQYKSIFILLYPPQPNKFGKGKGESEIRADPLDLFGGFQPFCTGFGGSRGKEEF